MSDADYITWSLFDHLFDHTIERFDFFRSKICYDMLLFRRKFILVFNTVGLNRDHPEIALWRPQGL